MGIMSNPQCVPRFNKENAKQYSLLGIAAIKAKREAKEKAEAHQRAVIEAIVQTRDDYPIERMVRVRKQLNRIDEMMLTEENPQAIDRLAAAAARLSEQERILAGRPLPGSHRPTKAPRSKAGDSTVVPE